MTTTSTTSASTTAATAALAATSSSTTASTNAAIGASILSSLNANGASIDTGSLVTSLTAAQKTSLETPITTAQTANTAQISSVASISSDLTAFSTSLNTLVSGGTLQTQPASSDSSVLTVTAVAGTAIGSLTSAISVTQIAKAQSVKSTAYATTQAFDTGTLSFSVAGGTAISVNVSSDNNTLAGIAQSINAAGAGVTASVISGSDGNSTLVLKGTSGAAETFTVTGTDSTDGSVTQPTGGTSLSALSFDPSATASASDTMISTQAAQDAQITVDGVTVNRSTNSFSDVVPGVQINLVGTGTTNLTSTPATAAITEAVNDFVSAYNELLTELNTATAAATSTADAGPLRGNAAIRTLQSQLTKMTTTPLNSSGTIRTLAELGVQTAQDGSLSVDATQLSTMLTSYPDDVEQMFMTTQTSSSPKVLINSTAGAAASGVYTVTGITPATGGGNATGTLNGTAMSAASWILTAGSGNNADGLSLQILSGTPSSATITINQGLGGVLQAIHDALLGTTGALTTLSTSLATQQTNLAAELTKADAQVTVYHDRLVTQFTQMNTLVSGYKATSSYLTQQVALWDNPDAS
jgi:flagellar hook-associated protein 2